MGRALNLSILKSFDMQISNSSGVFFRIKILGYQFPEAVDVPYDSNWLLVELELKHPSVNHHATEPCLMTYEANALAKWFKQVAAGNEEDAEIGFFEPNIAFKVVRPSILRLIANIPELGAVQGESNVDLEIDFSLDEINLPEAAKSLMKQLEPYPQRTDR